MATLTATEPVICPNAIAEAESIVPACMFAPDRGCEDDPYGAEGFEGCDGTNGESADHLDLSSKVGPYSQRWFNYCSSLDTFPLVLHVSRRIHAFVCISTVIPLVCQFECTLCCCLKYCSDTYVSASCWQVTLLSTYVQRF